MKLVFMTPAVGALAIMLTSCGSSKKVSDPLVSVGPFDKNGVYREDWADDPSKWRKTGGGPSPHELRSDQIPLIAKNDQPPVNANPLPPTQSRSTVPVLATRKPIVTPQRSAPTVVKSTPRPTPTKPKPVLVKAKPKPKPVAKTTRYVVKKGDSLSTIASRNGASVAAIKRENGISGTVIHPGQSLKIPK